MEHLGNSCCSNFLNSIWLSPHTYVFWGLRDPKIHWFGIPKHHYRMIAAERQPRPQFVVIHKGSFFNHHLSGVYPPVIKHSNWESAESPALPTVCVHPSPFWVTTLQLWYDPSPKSPQKSPPKISMINWYKLESFIIYHLVMTNS